MQEEKAWASLEGFSVPCLSTRSDLPLLAGELRLGNLSTGGSLEVTI